MSIRPRVAIAAATLAAVALVGGCSSSSKDASSATTTTAASSSGATAKAAFVTAANTICANASTQADATMASIDPSSAQSAIETMKAEGAILDNIVTSIQALPQPTGADAPTELYSTISALQSSYAQLVQAAESGDTAKGNAINAQVSSEVDAVDAAWTAYGVTTCGSGSSSGATTTTAG